MDQSPLVTSPNLGHLQGPYSKIKSHAQVLGRRIPASCKDTIKAAVSLWASTSDASSVGFWHLGYESFPSTDETSPGFTAPASWHQTHHVEGV